ncbi:hypothetical protein G3580_18045 [Nitrogeniibacter mangrovi]|uniref:Uncharacterized protein n=1 Tax=Nitrogeniibacter mangrovi TaxID=2016596 RepID=A0A6C1B9C5_9RHOO|nr:hypothetical protein [Nitrogeniibacter mangrovi]QID19348.1 hypothetical protein G3580_18045 [Nitrogeniibacter mangrovi]
MSPDRKHRTDDDAVCRGTGAARITVKRIGDLIADLLEMRAAEMEAAAVSARAAEAAAARLRLQAASARALVTVDGHPAFDRLALSAFANVLDESGGAGFKAAHKHDK